MSWLFFKIVASKSIPSTRQFFDDIDRTWQFVKLVSRIFCVNLTHVLQIECNLFVAVLFNMIIGLSEFDSLQRKKIRQRDRSSKIVTSRYRAEPRLKVYPIIRTPGEIQLYDSRGRVTQFARHQAVHGETSSKTSSVYRVYLYQILKFLDCTGLPSGTSNNPVPTSNHATAIRLNDGRNCL